MPLVFASEGGVRCRRSCLIPCPSRSTRLTYEGRAPSSGSLKMLSAGKLFTAHLTRICSNARSMLYPSTSGSSRHKSRSYRRRSANCTTATFNSSAGTQNWRWCSPKTRITLRARPQLIRPGPRERRACVAPQAVDLVGRQGIVAQRSDSRHIPRASLSIGRENTEDAMPD